MGPAPVRYRVTVPIRDELIERTVRQLAALMAKLLLARTSAVETARLDLPAAESELDDLYRANLGTSRGLVRMLGLEDLLGVIGTAGHVDGERAYVLGALLSVDAEVAVVSGSHEDDPEVLRLRNAALAMLLEAGAEKLGEADLHERVDALLAEVPPDARPYATLERRFRYELASERYARAEDALFSWLGRAATPYERDEVAAAGEAFYAALDAKTEAELVAGGFGREEIAEGRADFAAQLGG